MSTSANAGSSKTYGNEDSDGISHLTDASRHPSCKTVTGTADKLSTRIKGGIPFKSRIWTKNIAE